MPIEKTKNFTLSEAATILSEGTSGWSSWETIEPNPEIAAMVRETLGLKAGDSITIERVNNFIAAVKDKEKKESFSIDELFSPIAKTKPADDEDDFFKATFHSFDGSKHVIRVDLNKFWMDEGHSINLETMTLIPPPSGLKTEAPKEPKWRPSEQPESDWS